MSASLAIGIVAVSGGSFAIGAGRRALERLRARRALARQPILTPTTPEGEVVRVTGVVRAGERTLVAPLSGTICVVARSRVAVARWSRGALRPRESFLMVPFVLERDGDGPVAIEGQHALLDLDPIVLAKPRGKSSSEGARREAFLLRQGYGPRDGGNASFAETIVAPGMTVTIAGLVMKDPVEPVDAELGFRDGAARLRLAGNADHPLVIGKPA